MSCVNVAQGFSTPANNVWVSTVPLIELELRVGSLPIKPHPTGSWVIFIDEVPYQSWAHRCRYVLLDPDGTQREAEAEWFPTAWRSAFERV